ncbi:unnamed protein product [Hydatigera taeniaeformis]|uniref:Protein-serine O-palmitoleoyltransferase porcupine n=1 Tax=Hydatigena taeniaeformis TaxID=6205 RepID=A0A0R3X030_HYDTA|nr:unnamed protein product [Hydatigera taeniaeformis]
MSECTDDEIVIQLSPWGEFFVWIARHVERLRREHRIVGHLSIPPATTSGSSSSVVATASAYAVRLPLRLSLEETAVLLFHRLPVAIDSVRPVRSLNPPSPRSLLKFDSALALHYTESVKVRKQEKRQRMLDHYDEIRRGREKRKAREAAKIGGAFSTGFSDEEQGILYDENGVKLSKKRLKKLRREKRRTVVPMVESASDYPHVVNFSVEAKAKEQEYEAIEPLLTVDELMGITSTNDSQMVKYIPLHRPRATPQEWRRDGEHTTLFLPDRARDSIEKVALWLLEISSKLQSDGNEDAIVRCKVFDDLWSRGFYITCSASKMGGDFLVYQGEPPLLMGLGEVLAERGGSNRYCYYYNDDDGMCEDDFDYYEVEDVEEGFAAFCGSIIRQVWPNIWISLVACLVWRGCRSLFLLLLSFATPPNYLVQMLEVLLNTISILLGVVLLRHFFGDLYVRPCAFVFTVGVFLSFNTGVRDTAACGSKSQETACWTSEMLFVTICCLLLQLYCEFFMDPREWHMIRGTAMLLVMKAISVAASRRSEQQSLKMGFIRHYLSWCGYAFSPGSVIFGPWFGFESYLRATRLIHPSLGNPFWKDLLRTAVSFAIAIGCIIYSTYLSSIIYASYFLTFRWTNAYAQSQSFRFSHYFVSFFSQSLHQAIGFAALTYPNSGQKYMLAMVTNPVSIELPRSLVDVVVHWNFPMHFWLKQYIYKPTRRFGQLQALLLTYAFSSLLHGLNFQLAAVLFSIGMYAYIDFMRWRLIPTVWLLCRIEGEAVRPMERLHRITRMRRNLQPQEQGRCYFLLQANRLWVRGVNFLFGCLAIFHLAYLAVMFDTSEQQDEGYNMLHVLDKWSRLNFLSHIVAGVTYLLYLLI